MTRILLAANALAIGFAACAFLSVLRFIEREQAAYRDSLDA